MRDTRRARLALGLLLAAALILITVDHRANSGRILGPVREAASAVFGKIERASATVTAPITGFVGMLRGAPVAQRAIADLRRENSRLKEELSAQRIDQGRIDKLDRMLGLAGLGRYRVVAAQVVARRVAPGFEDAVEIDAGTRDGVRADMSVLSGDGLVGRVVQAGPTTATVALLTDPAVSAGARLEGGNELGVVSGLGEGGGGDNLVRFRLLDSSAPLSVGRRIVSFGSQESRPYVAGVPIGVIQRVETTPGELVKTAYAKPFIDFSALDVVGVVVAAPKRDPRDSVLPPVPKPAAPPARRDAEGRDHRPGRGRIEAEPGGRGLFDLPRDATGGEARGHGRAPDEGAPGAARDPERGGRTDTARPETTRPGTARPDAAGRDTARPHAARDSSPGRSPVSRPARSPAAGHDTGHQTGRTGGGPRAAAPSPPAGNAHAGRDQRHGHEGRA